MLSFGYLAHRANKRMLAHHWPHFDNIGRLHLRRPLKIRTSTLIAMFLWIRQISIGHHWPHTKNIGRLHLRLKHWNTERVQPRLMMDWSKNIFIMIFILYKIAHETGNYQLKKNRNFLIIFNQKLSYPVEILTMKYFRYQSEASTNDAVLWKFQFQCECSACLLVYIFKKNG